VSELYHLQRHQRICSIPARFGELYEHKPTHGAFNTTGVLIAIVEQDTPSFLTRSPSSPSSENSGLKTLSSKPKPKPSTLMSSNLLYFTEEPALVQPEVEAMEFDFFTKVAAALNMSTSPVNVTESCNTVGPSNSMSIYQCIEYV
jgi:hypothetical protein